MTVSVRRSTRNDAPAIARLEAEFSDYLESLGDPNPGTFSEERYLADGCGPGRAFSGLIAEIDSEPVGYLFYCPGYDSDHGGRIVWVVDLFVTQSARGRGVARSLMRAVARICRDSGGSQVLWFVYTRNKLAQQFYEHLGAKFLFSAWLPCWMETFGPCRYSGVPDRTCSGP